jgi:hypothetical protein
MNASRRCSPLLPVLASFSLVWTISPANAQLSPLGAQLLEECAASGACDANDNFGAAVATGDFNNDEFIDLAVGVPGEEVGGDAESGAVHIFFGSAGGLLLTGDAIFHQGTDGIDDTADPGDHFGEALAAADFNADGFDDLAIGAPDEDTSGLEDIGAVWILFGSPTGLTAAGSRLFGQGGISDTESSEAGDRFGAALAAGRINSGNRADLVIGVPGEDGIPGLENDSGKIHVLYNDGSAVLAREEDWTQSDVNCNENDENENGDGFGFALAVADFDDDGFADVIVGSPFEDCNGFLRPCDNRSDVGRVHVFTSSSTGLSSSEASCFGSDNGLIPSPQTQNDRLGGAFAAGDFNGDGVNDLAIGATGESFAPAQEGGVVEMILGQAGAGFNSGAQYSQNDVDPDQAESFDHFGAALAAGNFDGDEFVDLAVGVPDDDVSGNSDAGEIAVLYGSVTGLEAVGQGAFHSNLPPAMPDSPNPFDFFGAALAAGDFDHSGVDDLAIGIPGEDLGAAGAAGMVNVLYGLDRETGAFGTVEFGDNAGTVSESSGVRAVFLSRQGGAVLAASVEHARSGGTATLGSDVTYTNGSESWDPGELGSQHFLLNVLEDTLDEPDETLVITLSDPSAGTAIGSTPTFTLTITDNDIAGSLSFVQPVTPFLETAGSIQIPVARSGGAASAVTVQYTTANATATAGADYVAASGTLTWDAGETTQFVPVTLLDDNLAEPGEVFTITLSSPGGGGTLGFFTVHQVVIVDNEIFLDGFETSDSSRWNATVP